MKREALRKGRRKLNSERHPVSAFCPGSRRKAPGREQLTSGYSKISPKQTVSPSLSAVSPSLSCSLSHVQDCHFMIHSQRLDKSLNAYLGKKWLTWFIFLLFFSPSGKFRSIKRCCPQKWLSWIYIPVPLVRSHPSCLFKMTHMINHNKWVLN